MADTRCPHCDHVFVAAEITDEWCAQCGKHIPEVLLKEIRPKPHLRHPHPMPEAPKATQDELTRETRMPHELSRVDPTLWDRMKGLTEASLTQAIGKQIGKGEIRAIVERRDKMQKTIDALVKKNGETYVFMRDMK